MGYICRKSGKSYKKVGSWVEETPSYNGYIAEPYEVFILEDASGCQYPIAGSIVNRDFVRK